MIFKICAIAMVLIIASLVYWLIQTLHAAKQSLKQAEKTLSEVGSQMTIVVQEVSQLLRSSREITQNIQTKLQTLDTIFSSVGEASNAVRQVAVSVNCVSAAAAQTVAGVQETSHNQPGLLTEAVNLIGAGIKFWLLYQAQRRTNS